MKCLEVSQLHRKLDHSGPGKLVSAIEATAAEFDKNNFEEVLEIVAETVGENIRHLASSAEKAIARAGNLVELKGNACQLIKMCTSSVVDIL